MNLAFAALTLVLLAALAAGLLGRVWLPLDSFAIVQPYLVVVLLGLALPSILPGVLRGAMICLAALGAWDVLRHVDPGRPAEGAAIRHLQHNLHLGNRAPDLLDRMAEVETVTLQEVGEAIHALAGRPEGWHLRICPRPGWVSTAALTRLPVLDSGCTPSGAAWIRLRPPDCFGEVEALTLVSVHLFWPWPAGEGAQARQLAGLVAEIAALPGPILLGGDFNQMPWSDAAGRVARAARGEVTGGLHTTYTLADGWLRLPIDHLVADARLEVATARGGRHGSDHNALLAELGPAAPSGCPSDS
ncbi:endonuclease/exonuclease/phosphatase family protein [Jannaschia seohaensis]|uniref:Endonuclease/exonuclease/phosphatase (EEP) superfamily protein YafD n=1 Tax=Jannaschia seohaensis TaxID=475081 RepID=A0A2Y9ABJ6_9RHOB|nr:endonuclease/exonuclease/phosphatase family protein [Jannaschia seohaensis]PWJ21145.1 endonuclease/exonuclease/phosphatase (EEP) superfamily protein YafD [Jannaschia seohaensis]SSA41555.1 Uncharacterized conserved protein YafD, endonuclease/exonuclease/phosphatase (EEP) superfamily [Jannaschia seohaensis]